MKKFICLLAVLMAVAFALCPFKKDKIKIYLHQEDKCMTMDFEKYIAGVLSAEMGVGFHEEALKAQAVAARTYTLSKLKNEESRHKGGAPLCTNSAHCQAYRDIETICEKEREVFENAVKQTKGKIITYNGAPIRALFHAASCGKTENSRDVFGGDFPYLTSVESYGDNLCPNYETTVTFSKKELGKILNVNPRCFVENIQRSEGGGVLKINLGGKEFKGTEVRGKLNLRSTCFNIEGKGSEVLFTVKGYGHGVGMSQWGANAMAQNGKNYKEILTHYYKNTRVE